MTTSQRPVNIAETVIMEAAKIELIEEQLNDLLSMVSQYCNKVFIIFIILVHT